ncbi:glycosyl transferase family protein [Caballeronia hypogeia]|uniref:Glycosyl transferase family protein n=1 Tax=Caballeronia hypogeia TaxID=1777140 RepID=A0A158DEF7_9BURK|nr:glycosyltransferase [Caballeronia hypogeia]SAK92948.1 glycosyl transferase family protein [Caballeronia hypogeia]
MSTLSVVVAVYVKDDPSLFRLSLWSNALDQSERPDHLVVVADGPLSPELEHVLDEAAAAFGEQLGPHFMTLVRLPENRGLAAARNASIAQCRSDYIALADADDISLPERFRLQKLVLDADRETDVVTAWQYDYRLEEGRIVGINKCPAEPEEIAALLQTRNPICHPSMMIRRDAVVRHGGYDESVRLLEDYELHLRWHAQGARYRCVQEPLVRVSVAADLYRRRGGLAYARRELAFRIRAMRRGHLAGGLRFCCITALFAVFRLVPPGVRRRCYILTRKRSSGPATP